MIWLLSSSYVVNTPFIFYLLWVSCDILPVFESGHSAETASVCVCVCACVRACTCIMALSSSELDVNGCRSAVIVGTSCHWKGGG